MTAGRLCLARNILPPSGVPHGKATREERVHTRRKDE
jgi:hypothetical protein